MFSLKTCVTCQKNTRKRALFIILAISMLSMVLMGAVYDSKKDVTLRIYDDFSGVDMVKNTVTRQETVLGLLSEVYLEVGEYDSINKDLSSELSDGDDIIIRRGRLLTVLSDGTVQSAATTYKKVADALNEAGISVGADDIVEPALNESIGNDAVVKITRVNYEEVSQTESIAFNETTVEDSSLYIGESEVRQAGVNGEKIVTSRITYHDGAEVAREVIEEQITLQPSDKITAVGTKKKENTHPAGFNYKKKLTVTATAYDPYPAGGSGTGITANGMKAQYGVVAVDPKVIPLGTKLYIESTDDGQSWSYGYCIAADTGGAIKGNKIDLCYNTVGECIQFGRRSANVYILE